MELEFLAGYDGPFRIWLNEQPFLIDMKGTNPALADLNGKRVKLAPGTHDVHVGMDLNKGLAWGFFLRLARLDLTREQIETGNFTKPVYL